MALVYAMSGVFSLIDVRDPANYVGVALAIAIVTATATYVPARRAARIDPLLALRNE
jgi:ABC-type lipoprotein release transport system permease subunit